jgi:N-acyl-L-homoserine lactone synthetase
MTVQSAATTASALLDSKAETFLEAARPFDFRPAGSPAELEMGFRLRYRVAAERGWVSVEDFPRRVERDFFDDDAVHIAGWDDGDMVATMRLVFRSRARRIPVEELFDLDIAPGKEVVEWGRISVAPERRSPDHRIFWGLLARGWLEGRARGVSVVTGIASKGMIARYRKAGFPVQVLGEPRLHWGEKRHPIVMDPGNANPP